jgi:hypothetical protein
VVERVLTGFDDPDDNDIDGIVEFVRKLKLVHPAAAAGLLSRLMPSSLDIELNGNVSCYGDIIVRAIAHGDMLGPPFRKPKMNSATYG